MKATTQNKNRKMGRVNRPTKVKYNIPTGVQLAVDGLTLSDTNKGHANRFVSRIITNSKIQEKSLADFVEVYSRDFPNSNRWLPQLLEKGIVESDEKFRSTEYNNGEPKCLGYRINYYLIHNPDTLTPANILRPVQQPHQSLLFKGFVRSANAIEIHEQELKSKLDEIVDNITVDSFTRNSAIPHGQYETGFLKRLTTKKGDTVYRVQWVKHPCWASWSQKEADKLGVDAILDDTKVIIGSIEQFLKQKQKDSLLYNTLAIERLANKDYKPSISLTNNRFNTSFTNFNKELFELIKVQNGLCELDCKNSQYALLANKIGKNVDEAFYNSAAIQGKLYEHLALLIDPSLPKAAFNFTKGTKEELAAGQKARKKAKLLMMLLVFGKPNTKIEYLDLFKSEYPYAHAWIVDYKTNNPENIKSGRIQSSNDFYRALPTALQLMESEFWINHVLMECYRRGKVAISRHDSISCAIENKDEVVSIIEEAKLKFGYNFRL